MNDATKNLQDELKDSAHRIWLAGLGALAAAGEEGTKMFDRLVDRGREYETRGREEARKQYEGAKTSTDDFLKTWSDKLDESVTKALHRMGVPSRDEIHNLTRRVEELNAKVEMLKPRVTPAGGHSPYGEPIVNASPIVTPSGEPAGTPVTPGTSAPTLDTADPSKIIA
ncbi:MAG TPA: phasin family protein [Thermoanaerobaculia bacterium]|jgi:poly(hydroxyalkanoate) granule-associated protein|nr:phasin family protein [Thermoanaerobaculia bacterium]